jgi:HK97 family phage major capsid protein
VAEERGCITGTGEFTPYGLLHDEFGAEVGTTTETLTYDSVVALYFSLDAQYRKNAVWVMNDRTALALRSLKSDDGLPLWNHNNDTLFSKPVFIAESMPDVGAGNKPLLFGDFSFFLLMERGDAVVQTVKEPYILNGLIAYYGIKRMDSRLVRRTAVKALQMS